MNTDNKNEHPHIGANIRELRNYTQQYLADNLAASALPSTASWSMKKISIPDTV